MRCGQSHNALQYVIVIGLSLRFRFCMKFAPTMTVNQEEARGID